MQVLVNTDHHITGREDVTLLVESVVAASVEHFMDRITRVEVHLNDVNGAKHGERDKRCMMEARVGGVAPVAVTNEAPSLIEAIEGAGGKLQRALEHTLGRLAAKSARSPREADTAGLERLIDLGQREKDKT